VPVSGVLPKLRGLSDHLTPAERRACDYVLAHPEFVLASRLNEVAKASRSSEATIIRLCRKADLSGYQELRLALAQEDNGRGRDIEGIHEDVGADDSPRTVLDKVFHSFIDALKDTLDVVDADQFAAAVAAISGARSLSFFGFGASGAAAQAAHFRFMRLGAPTYVLTDVSAQLSRVALLGPGDVVVAISHSGRTKDLVFSAGQARERGARVVAITQYGKSPLTDAADHALHTSSVETAFRAEAMASRVAQQALLDALFVAVSLPKSHEVVGAVDEHHRLLDALRQR
jgi:DNA-binding MurR/RpiR family transcriptional regulator